VEIRVVAPAVLAIGVHQLCKALFPCHLVLYHLVKRCVKVDTQHNAQMEPAVPTMHARRATVVKTPTGLVHSARQTNATQEHVVVLGEVEYFACEYELFAYSVPIFWPMPRGSIVCR
jgi:hypothetical protein